MEEILISLIGLFNKSFKEEVEKKKNLEQEIFNLESIQNDIKKKENEKKEKNKNLITENLTKLKEKENIESIYDGKILEKKDFDLEIKMLEKITKSKKNEDFERLVEPLITWHNKFKKFAAKENLMKNEIELAEKIEKIIYKDLKFFILNRDISEAKIVKLIGNKKYDFLNTILEEKILNFENNVPIILSTNANENLKIILKNEKIIILEDEYLEKISNFGKYNSKIDWHEDILYVIKKVKVNQKYNLNNVTFIFNNKISLLEEKEIEVIPNNYNETLKNISELRRNKLLNFFTKLLKIIEEYEKAINDEIKLKTELKGKIRKIDLDNVREELNTDFNQMINSSKEEFDFDEENEKGTEIDFLIENLTENVKSGEEFLKEISGLKKELYNVEYKLTDTLREYKFNSEKYTYIEEKNNITIEIEKKEIEETKETKEDISIKQYKVYVNNQETFDNFNKFISNIELKSVENLDEAQIIVLGIDNVGNKDLKKIKEIDIQSKKIFIIKMSSKKMTKFKEEVQEEFQEIFDDNDEIVDSIMENIEYLDLENIGVKNIEEILLKGGSY